jgi:hypothetical protein
MPSTDKLVSQSFPKGAIVRGAATEFRARRLFTSAMAAFRSNLLDAADLSPAFRDQLLSFLRQVDAQAPTMAEWDKAMAEPVTTSSAEQRELSFRELLAAAGNGRGML